MVKTTKEVATEVDIVVEEVVVVAIVEDKTTVKTREIILSTETTTVLLKAVSSRSTFRTQESKTQLKVVNKISSISSKREPLTRITKDLTTPTTSRIGIEKSNPKLVLT